MVIHSFKPGIALQKTVSSKVDKPFPEEEPFLNGWREQEPPPPGPEVWRAAAKGALWGAAAGAAIGGYTHLSYQALPIPEAAGLQFGSLILGFTGGATLLGPKLHSKIEPSTAAALSGVGGLTLSLVSYTLAMTMGVGPATVGGALVGAALGFTGGLILEDGMKPKS
ncbi:hypothetical protein ABS71_14615 [bacterium SCN 62-11]|nr:MAG: hypothetical protein ABS71_14615 [bacterium SCN 62-11]